MPFPVDEKYIRETQLKLRVTLPASYIQKMKQHNGGEVQTPADEWVLYPVFDSSDKKRLKRTCNDVVRETMKAREWPGFPVDGVAIAGNGCGDQLVLMRDVKFPERLANDVFCWNHETGELELTTVTFGDGVG